MYGCFSHFNHTIWEQIQKHGFLNKYFEDIEFALQKRTLETFDFSSYHSIKI